MKTTTNHGERVARFEAAFNQIHIKLKQLTNDPRDFAPFGDVLYAARKLHSVIRYNYDALKQFGYLRNAIVHNKVNESFYIAEPHEDVVANIEKIRDLIHTPPFALSIASQPVKVFDPSTSLEEILDMITQTGYSQFPIYNESGFQGLLTEGGIAKWMAKHIAGNSVSIQSVQAKDILAFEKKHNVHFIGRTSSIYDLEAIYEDSFDQNKKLEAILITEKGLPTQKPIGIVTSWDLIKIDHTSLMLASQV
ncbi:CBS domain-containing protein [Bacillus salinus]|uniref:CBS domain-containing protein n=1 Tax=Bacillus sp. HMF5848 TaxID=2495421 RepID=UPI00163A04C5|nr:CBS domain-containing protein [Bacillus sp. HMF5848]